MRNIIELSMICVLFGIHPVLSGAVFVFCLFGRFITATLITEVPNEKSNQSKQNQLTKLK